MKKLSTQKFIELEKKDKLKAQYLMQVIVDGFRKIQAEHRKQGETLSDNEAMDMYLQRKDLPDDILDLLIEVNYGAKISQDDNKMRALQQANKNNVRTLEVESRVEYNKSMAQGLFDEILRRADAGEI